MKKLSLLFFITMLGIGAFAQTTRYWSGKSTTTDNISDGTNWWDGVNPNSGDHLVFDHTDGRHWASSNYATGSWFGDIIIKEGAGSIKFLGDNTYALKFENNSENELFEIANGTIGNRLGSDLRINPYGTGGILVSGSFITLEGAKILHFYGSNTATINGEIKEINGTGKVHVHDSKVILKSASTYTGTTTIDNLGVLEIQKDMASAEIIVTSGAKLVINGTDVDIQKLTISTGGIVEVAAGKSLTVNGTLTNNGTLTLKSTTDGTATIVTKGAVTGTTFNVEQYLASQRNWYMSSPVAAAARPGSEYSDVEVYNEADNTWSEMSGTMEVGKGYVVYPVTTGEKTLTFTGTLNTGDKTIGLTRTTANTTYQGFNLVGNPYPSYLNAKSLLDNNTASVFSTIWYRTKATNWTFYTYNATGAGISVPADANLDKIPPMQGFWVRAISDNVTLNFNANWRLHNETATSIPFKAPAAVANQILRLQLTNGTATDETVLYFNANAADGYDAYDSPKMLNNGTTVPNLYTTVGTEKLVINGMNAIPYNVVLPLSLQGAAGNYTITASEFSNFAEGDKVQLIDTKGATTDLTPGSSYTFSIAAGENTTGRFSVVFPKSGVPTGVDNAGAGDVTVFTRSSRIVVTANEAAQGSMIYVFNGVGQRLAAQAVSGTVNEIGRTFPAGVYVVKVNNTTAKVVVK